MSRCRASVPIALLLVVCALDVGAQPLASAKPGALLDATRLAQIGPVVEEAVAAHKLPGAVIVAGRGDRVEYRQAFGNRALVPSVEPMTLDTIFDLASLTKVVATTTAVMQLVENGRIRLADKVSAYVPGFERYGKDRITIRHLLTHTSGLRPDFELSVSFEGEGEAIRRAIEEVPVASPGERFIYSDINFFLLGHIVGKVSGERLDAYAARHIFTPLGMSATTFLPAASLTWRIAPTEACERLAWPCGQPGTAMMRGLVHDPTARRMGGVAGHAGLFSTGDDLSIFVRMLLDGGSWHGARILSPLSVAAMTRRATPPAMTARRGLGWDIDSAYSSNRGELLPIGSFGHTGFTGTSIWADPLTGAWIVFLSNRVHPDGHGDVTALRARVASIVASAVPDVQLPPSTELTGAEITSAASVVSPARVPLETGIDVLRAEGFARLHGRHVGLLTNQSGRASDGTSTIDLLHGAKGVTLVALLSPEHGIRGALDESVPSSADPATGLPIYSLYGATRRPTGEMLKGIDTIVVDLQDVGVRFYTYPTTVAYVMEEAAKRQMKVVVLDRPNPVNGWQIEGPALDKDSASFVGYFPPMPIRHGMTLGELARLFNGENRIGADLNVVAMKNWRRDEWFDETALPWISPSPNMRNMNEAALYTGIGAIEYSNISVGRGTDTPFEHIGAPWIDGVQLADTLNARALPGVRFYPVRFTPASSKYAGEECQGVFVIVTDRAALRPVRVGLEIASALARLYPRQYQLDLAARLFGSRDTLARVRTGDDPAAIAASWGAAESRWRLLRAKYLLYQ